MLQSEMRQRGGHHLFFGGLSLEPQAGDLQAGDPQAIAQGTPKGGTPVSQYETNSRTSEASECVSVVRVE